MITNKYYRDHLTILSSYCDIVTDIVTTTDLCLRKERNCAPQAGSWPASASTSSSTRPARSRGGWPPLCRGHGEISFIGNKWTAELETKVMRRFRRRKGHKGRVGWLA